MGQEKKKSEASVPPSDGKVARQFLDLLFGYGVRRTMEMKVLDLQVIHYTTAENAMNILGGKTLWLRNAAIMNDFSEIAHGRDVLDYAFKRSGHRLARALGGDRKLQLGIEDDLFTQIEVIQTTTYMTALAEHGADDNANARVYRARRSSSATARLSGAPAA